MHIVLVHVKIKPEYQLAFEKASLENARNSINELGIARFDILRMADDPNHYVLNETYLTPEDQIKHRESKHYQVWKDTVSEMMAEPRLGVKYINLFPNDSDW
jgi:autoinducer 2-degrading protein